MKNFRVLTVTTDENRIETMISTGRQVDPSGSGLFLFADQKTLAAEAPPFMTWIDGRGKPT
jgi:hypothetical protein